jgi:hypothetical protein
MLAFIMLYKDLRSDLYCLNKFIFSLIRQKILGYKSLNNTMLYTQLVNFKDDDFTAVVAHSEQEACKLIEGGFEFVCDFNGNKLFRKCK